MRKSGRRRGKYVMPWIRITMESRGQAVAGKNIANKRRDNRADFAGLTVDRGSETWTVGENFSVATTRRHSPPSPSLPSIHFPRVFNERLIHPPGWKSWKKERKKKEGKKNRGEKSAYETRTTRRSLVFTMNFLIEISLIDFSRPVIHFPSILFRSLSSLFSSHYRRNIHFF